MGSKIYGFDHEDITLLSDAELIKELFNHTVILTSEYYRHSFKRHVAVKDYKKLKAEALNRMSSSDKSLELDLLSKIEELKRNLTMLREERSHFDNLYQKENKTEYLEIALSASKNIELKIKDIQQLESELQVLRR